MESSVHATITNKALKLLAGLEGCKFPVGEHILRNHKESWFFTRSLFYRVEGFVNNS